jgi:hypothetical protein
MPGRGSASRLPSPLGSPRRPRRRGSPIRCPSSVKLARQLGSSWAMRRAAAIGTSSSAAPCQSQVRADPGAAWRNASAVSSMKRAPPLRVGGHLGQHLPVGRRQGLGQPPQEPVAVATQPGQGRPGPQPAGRPGSVAGRDGQSEIAPVAAAHPAAGLGQLPGAHGGCHLHSCRTTSASRCRSGGKRRDRPERSERSRLARAVGVSTAGAMRRALGRPARRAVRRRRWWPSRCAR